MKDDDHDAILSDWIMCEVRSGGLFLAGRIDGDRKGRFADGRYIATSFLVSPADQIIEGQVIQTLNSRYLLGARNTTDDTLFAKLGAWVAERPSAPTILNVINSGDGELMVAYILRALRQATAEAVAEHKAGE